MLRVHRDNDGEWWLERHGLGVHPQHWRDGLERVKSLDELEPEVSDRLSALLFADPGTALPNIGRRIDEKTFWLFYED